MYAIIVTGGKQYRVEQGDIVYIEKLDAEADSEVKFDQVLAVGEEGSVKVGAPVVEGASVSAKVIKNGKGKKLNIITYRPKSTVLAAWAIVSPTPRLRSLRSTAKEEVTNGTQERRRQHQERPRLHGPASGREACRWAEGSGRQHPGPAARHPHHAGRERWQGQR